MKIQRNFNHLAFAQINQNRYLYGQNLDHANALFSFCCYCSMLVFQPKVKAQTLSPQATVSILTCNPGKEVYSMYGHTAIRVSDPCKGAGCGVQLWAFQLRIPNFIYRFAKGQTDYLMGGQRFSSFLPEYEQDKRSVYEQVLNLSAEGKNNCSMPFWKMPNLRTENTATTISWTTVPPACAI